MKKSVILFLALLLVISGFAAKEWTIIVYLNCDNNLEPFGITDFLEMSSVGSDANINIVVQMDRATGYSTTYGNWTTCKRFYITQGMTPDASNALSDLGEVDMGRATTLSTFVNWAIDNYPANHYLVDCWNHGDGWTKGVAIHGGIFKDFSNDNSSGNSISVANGELDSALSTINNHIHQKIDLIGFDACLMNMFEVNEVCSPYADWFVGSEELEGADGWVYDSFLGPLAQANGQMTPQELGDKIASTYVASNQSTQSVINLAEAANFKTKLNAFAVSMMQARGGGYGSTIESLINNTTHFLQGYLYYSPESDYRDLGDFLDKVIASSLPPYSISKAQDLKNYFTNIVYSNYTRGTGYANCDGIAIYLPLPSNYSANKTLYTKLPIADGDWDEFIEGISMTPPNPTVNLAYYSNIIDDSVGGNNDGDLDGGETVDLDITLINNEGKNLTGVSGILSTINIYTTINTDLANYPDFGTKANNKKQTSLTPYNFSVNKTCPAGENIDFQLNLTTDQGANTVFFTITVDQMAPKVVNLIYDNHIIDDSIGGNNDGNADAAEDINVTITLKNTEIDGATGVSATISTSNSYTTINSNSSTYPDIASGATGQSDTPYQIFISTNCPAGEVVLFDIDITANEGIWTDTFTITVDRPYEPVLYSGSDVLLFPSWSHSGDPRKIVYIVKTGAGTEIRIKNSDGTGSETVVADTSNSVSHISQICWSPDDQYILFAGMDPIRILISKSDGSSIGNSQLMQPDSSVHYYKFIDPNWTDSLNQPDGKERITVSVSGDIWTYIPYDTTYDSGLLRITALSDNELDMTKVDKYFQPIWSPDNTKIAFVRRPATRTNRVAKTDIYVVDGVLDIISGTNTYVGSLTDPRMTLVDGGDAPNYSPSFSIDGTIISYVKDVLVKFNNHTFYTDPGGQIAAANFDGYGNGSVLGNPPLNNIYNEGFLKWATSGGDRFTFVKEEAGNYELRVICDPSVGGFAKEDGTSNYVLKDRSRTTLTISETDKVSILVGEISAPISVPASHIIGLQPIGSYRNIVINGQNDYQFIAPARLFIFYSKTEIPKSYNENDITLYRYEDGNWLKIDSSIIDDTDGNPENDIFDGGFVVADINKAGLYGLFTTRTVDDNRVEEGDFIMGPNPANNYLNIFAENPEKIDIYSISGVKIASLSESAIEKVHGNKYVWRLKNNSGKNIKSGIYLIYVKFFNGSQKLKKAAIIR